MTCLPLGNVEPRAARPQGSNAEPGCEVRLHDRTLYSSLFRYDDIMLVNPPVWGQPASANPLFELKRAGDSGWFATYAQSFESVWGTARPWTPDQEGTAAHGPH